MPMFDYLCNCGNVEQDVLQGSKEKRVRCKKCGKYMKKKMSSAAVKYNCGGFYDTDYKGR